MAQRFTKRIISWEDMDEACHVLTRSFIETNSIYKKFGAKYEEINPYFRHDMTTSIQNDLAYGLQEQGRLVGIFMNFDLDVYKESKLLESRLQLIDFQRKYISLSEEPLLQANHKKGEVVYGGPGAMLPEYQSQGIALFATILLIIQLKNRGYKTYYTNLCFQKSLKLFKHIGADIVKKVDCQGHPKLQGESYTLVKVDLTKKYPTEAQLYSMFFGQPRL